MFFPVIEREKSKASEEKLTEVYEHFLKLFMRHSETLNYRTRIYNIIEYYQFDYKKIDQNVNSLHLFYQIQFDQITKKNTLKFVCTFINTKFKSKTLNWSIGSK